MIKQLSVTLFFTALMAVTLTAQDAEQSELTNDKGQAILPEEGDCALGVDAVPFLNYFGNMFNNTTNNSVFFDHPHGQMISAKHFLAADKALRGRARLAFSSSTNKGYVTDDQNTQEEVLDKKTQNTTMVGIYGGYECRKGGAQRVQFFYGGELGLLYSSTTFNYSYANEFSENNTAPTTYDFGNNFFFPDERVTTRSVGSSFSVQLRGFAGVEYFFAPKISVSGEFGWGPAYSTTADGETEIETWDDQDDTIETNTTNLAGSSSFSLDTDNASGALSLMFHF